MVICYFFFQAEDGIRVRNVTGVQTYALPISTAPRATPTPMAAGRFRPGPRLLACGGSARSAGAGSVGVPFPVGAEDLVVGRAGTPTAASGGAEAAGCAVGGWLELTGPRPASGRTMSDGRQLGLLRGQRLIDLIGVLLRDGLELLLRPGALVLTDLLVLDQLLDGLLRVAAGAAHGDLPVLGL